MILLPACLPMNKVFISLDCWGCTKLLLGELISFVSFLHSCHPCLCLGHCTFDQRSGLWIAKKQEATREFVKSVHFPHYILRVCGATYPPKSNCRMNKFSILYIILSVECGYQGDFVKSVHQMYIFSRPAASCAPLKCWEWSTYAASQ